MAWLVSNSSYQSQIVPIGLFPGIHIQDNFVLAFVRAALFPSVHIQNNFVLAFVGAALFPGVHIQNNFVLAFVGATTVLAFVGATSLHFWVVIRNHKLYNLQAIILMCDTYG